MKPPSKTGCRGKHRQHRAIQQPDHQRHDQVNRNRYEQGIQMKCGELSRTRGNGFGEKAGDQEIDRIPDAGLAKNAVGHREHRHCHASSQAALDSRRNRVDFEGSHARRASCPDLDSVDFAARGHDGRRFRRHRDGFMRFMRQNRAKPANDGGN